MSVKAAASAMRIQEVRAREIIDSRGNPTVEVDLRTSDGALHRAAVPSGASTGIHEALELRDGDAKRYNGKGVLKAVRNVSGAIADALVGRDPADQAALDAELIKLDGTKSKSNLGANAILGASMAACKAGAWALRRPLYAHIAALAQRPTDKFVLPVPVLNVLNGGTHAGNNLAMQEFMIMPVGASSFRQAMQMGSEIYHALKGVIKAKYGQDAVNVGDEGGFAPSIQKNDEALDLLMSAIAKAGYEGKIKLAMDVAASEFYKGDAKVYDLLFKAKNNDGSGRLDGKALTRLYGEFCAKYPIVSIEDPFDQDDWAHYTHMMSETASKKLQIVGDDLLVTNVERIDLALQHKACNALLLKVNQIGSVTEAIAACTKAQRAGWGVMVSHRSGETEDCFIADLVVGLGTGQIKTGAPCRSERLAKYNQLMRIEEELGANASYAGTNFRQLNTATGL